MSAPFGGNIPSRWTTAERILAASLAVLTLVISATTSITTTNSQLAGKVDRSEYQAGLQALQQQIVRDSVRQAEMLDYMRNMKTSVDSSNLRLRQIWCDGKAPSCR